MISPVEVIWAKEVIGGGSSAYGIVLSAWGAGHARHRPRARLLWRRLPVVTRIPLAAGTMGVGYVVMALAGSLPVGALGCFIGGLGNGFYFVSVIQAIQDRTADEYQGRVMGLLESATAGCYGVGLPARRRDHRADLRARHLRRDRGRRHPRLGLDGRAAACAPQPGGVARASLRRSPPRRPRCTTPARSR